MEYGKLGETNTDVSRICLGTDHIDLYQVHHIDRTISSGRPLRNNLPVPEAYAW